MSVAVDFKAESSVFLFTHEPVNISTSSVFVSSQLSLNLALLLHRRTETARESHETSSVANLFTERVSLLLVLHYGVVSTRSIHLQRNRKSTRLFVRIRLPLPYASFRGVVCIAFLT
jgi:hypothetical protein